MDVTHDYQSEFKADITASEIVESNMNKYARYVLLDRLPNHIDGLKLIHRRILMALGTTEDKMKGNALIGKVMGTYHPHGDASIYDAIIRLAQPFNQVYPFVKVYGNVGDYSGEPAAAARYTDITSSEFSRDLFFNSTNMKTLTYIPSETGTGVEPAYFIPVLPTALITGAHTIGVGVKSIIPYLELSSVCDLVERYIAMRRADPIHFTKSLSTLSKYMIPDTPTHSLLRNGKELLAKYTNGEFGHSAMMDGVLDIYPDCIHIRTIPYGRCLKDVLGKIEGMFKTANFISAGFQEVSDISTGFEYGDVKLQLKRGLDPFSVLDDLKKFIGFTARQSYLWNFTNQDGSLLELTPYQIIDMWYRERCRSILGDLKYSRDALFKQYRRLTALIVIADYTDEVLTIFKKAENREATIEPLCTRFKLSETQAKYLASLQMHQITKQGKDELLKELESIKAKINELQTKFTDIDNIIITDVHNIKKKYAPVTKRRLKYPNFIGAIQLPGSGFIQYETLDELAKLEKRWARSEFKIHGYPIGHTGLCIRNDDSTTIDTIIEHPKEFRATDIYAYKNKPKHTIQLGNGQIFRIPDIFFSDENGRRNTPVYDEFLALDAKNKLVQYKATDIVKRQSILAEGVKTNIVYVSSCHGEQAVVVFVNESKPNKIIFELVKTGSNMQFPGIGTLYIYGIFKLTDRVVFSIQPRHSFRCSIKHIYIPLLSDVMMGDTRVECFLNTRKFSNNAKFKPLDKSSVIWVSSNRF